MAALNKPPEADEIEISLFGPGFGECAVLHIGEGDWIIIDSCLDPDTRKPVALKYLDQLGVDPKDQVRCIIGTHWHDDHIQGLASLVKAAPDAAFAISGALRHAEFQSLLKGWLALDSVFLETGLDQLREIVQLKGSPILASENKIVYERNTGTKCEIRALSPSDDGITATLARFPTVSNFGRRLPRIEGNHASVAVSVDVTGRRILLGGDLEVRANRSFGWLRVIDAHQDSGKAKHEAYKIPHHGSANGDHDEIWKSLLGDDPHSLVSPFVSGSVKLPGKNERSTIKSRTPNGYLTALPDSRKFKHANRMVEKTMQEATSCLEKIPKSFGHVRLRSKILNEIGDWNVELFGAAEAV